MWAPTSSPRRQIWPALATLPPSPLDGEYRLTDLVHRLIRSGLAGGELPDLRPGRDPGDQHPRGPGAGRVHPAEAALPPAPAGGAQHRPVRHRRLARGDRRGLHAAQRAPAVPGAGQRHHPPRAGEARRADRLRPPLPLRPGRRGRGRGLRRQQHPHDPAERGRADAADQLRHRGRQRGLRPGLHRQPQPAGVERPQGLPRRRLAAADRRDRPDRGRDQPPDPGRRGQDPAGHRAGGRHRRAARLHQRSTSTGSSRSSTWTPSARPG